MKKLILSLVLIASGLIAQISPPPNVGSGTFVLPSTAVITSTTNNTAMGIPFSGQNNGCNPLTDFQSAQGANFANIGLAGCVAVASGSTQQGANGVQGSVTNSSTTTNAVGGYFPAFAGAAGSGATDPQRVRIWGINPLASDKGFANVLLTNEMDFNVTGTSTKVLGLQFVGASTQALLAGSAGIIFGPPGTGITWPVAMQCSDAASVICNQIGATATTNNVSSQILRFISRTAGGVTNSLDITEGPGGSLGINTVATAGISFQQATVNQLVMGSGGSLNMLGLTLATLAPTTNGTIVYCTDCLNASNPCSGASTGAFAKRLGGAWDCR